MLVYAFVHYTICISHIEGFIDVGCHGLNIYSDLHVNKYSIQCNEIEIMSDRKNIKYTQRLNNVEWTRKTQIIADDTARSSE